MLVKVLCNDFGFEVRRQRGSHIILAKGRTRVTVPAKEVRVGLLAEILDSCRISRDEYMERI